MTSSVMVFASMLVSPLSAFLCDTRFLPFFSVLPVAALVLKRFSYFKALFFAGMAPCLLLAWALFAGDHSSAMDTIRWICALATGVFFAGSLGASGIEVVLRKASFFPPALRLAGVIAGGGAAMARAGGVWRENSHLPVQRRVEVTLRESLTVKGAEKRSFVPQGAAVTTVAAGFWLFLLGNLAGVLR